jgi:hypothetical protein
MTAVDAPRTRQYGLPRRHRTGNRSHPSGVMHPASRAGLAPVTTRTGPVRPADTRRVMRAGVCMALLAAGAILRFAGAPGSHPGLNVHAAGVTVMGAGDLGLLSLLVWGPLNPAWRRRQHPQSQRASPAAAARHEQIQR